MVEFSHRDRRAHRDLGRAFGTMAVAILAMTALALVLPFTAIGLAAVVVMGGLGVGYVAWSERMLQGYSRDLRLARDGGVTDGFLRFEMATPVGLDRAVGHGTVPSPHARRRHPGAGGARDDAPAESSAIPITPDRPAPARRAAGP